MSLETDDARKNGAGTIAWSAGGDAGAARCRGLAAGLRLSFQPVSRN
jgi:hypothetical protein